MKLRILLFTLIAATSTCYSQQNEQEKIHGKWMIEKFEIRVASVNAGNIQDELKGIVLIFGKDVVEILKKEEGAFQFIKSGPYKLKGNSITIGADDAEIRFLDKTSFELIIPKQGVILFKKIS